MTKVLEKSIKQRYKPMSEWEDKHPFLATLIIIFYFLTRPFSLFVFVMLIIFLVIMGMVV